MQLKYGCAVICRNTLGPNETICHISLRYNIKILQLVHIDWPCWNRYQAVSEVFWQLLTPFVSLSCLGKHFRRMKLYYDIIADYPWPRWLSQDIMADRIIRGTVAWLYSFPDTCLSYYDISTTYKQPYDAKIDHIVYSKVFKISQNWPHGLCPIIGKTWIHERQIFL